ncbi:hypothetical protein PC9H_009405 [Pleurotus ostreatus]|uniref:Nicotinamide-nucleotide adenylyltransferase n=1 Tax=Pleurotus ostreatus TaxID=5322 RepID=A0A8H6ZPM6_PLEOS|nr:uncharacterized protein PC9H_009405 [Pleurotus ostreatus]KAF7424102.1 hypothetical protein PC9H_009405 [Pleurotus ostreatus]KAJ8693070.1 hypothetical protein PTI98_010318 [Pleurotus ostreatus]
MHVPSRAGMLSLLHRVQQNLAPVELIYVPHDAWPLHKDEQTAGRSPRPVRISVLDSSFNPPTLAHLALANSPRPKRSFTDERDGATSDDLGLDYDAKLLLLSVRNADKVLKQRDASLVQRLEMMVLLAKDIVCPPSGPPDVDRSAESNVAVAIIDEPTFVGKSTKLLTFLRNRLAGMSERAGSSAMYEPKLTFLLGFDTLERLLSPRYYAAADAPAGSDSMEIMMVSLRRFLSPAPLGDDSAIVCARRTMAGTYSFNDKSLRSLASSGIHNPQNEDASTSPSSSSTALDLTAEERKTLNTAREFVDSQRIQLIEIGDAERTFSSSAVREMKRVTSRTIDFTAPSVTSGGEWRRLVPDRIAEYMVQEGLYQDS